MPAISGDTFIWQDDRNGTTDIYYVVLALFCRLD